jgi:hypothetical protein
LPDAIFHAAAPAFYATPATLMFAVSPTYFTLAIARYAADAAADAATLPDIDGG